MTTPCCLLAAAVLAGCIEPDYPGRWPALVPAAADCPSLAGVYRNEGERGDPAGAPGPIPLTYFLLPDLQDDESIDAVEILEPAAGVIEVVASSAGRVVSRRQFSAAADEYGCSDGCVEMSTSRWVSEQISGKQWDRADYCRSVDGSLIVKSTTSGMGVILLVIPVGGSESKWFRFQPKEAR